MAKVISLLQPWAHLVVIGAKRIETRSWSTNYRGPLLIHASKRFTKDQAKLCQKWPFNEYIENLEDLEFGYIIGSVNLIDVKTTEYCVNSNLIAETERNAEEYNFGNYNAGRFAWILSEPKEFNEIIPCNGKLGIWNFEMEIKSS